MPDQPSAHGRDARRKNSAPSTSQHYGLSASSGLAPFFYIDHTRGMSIDSCHELRMVIRGDRTGVLCTRMPSERSISSNLAVNLASRSRTRNLTRLPPSRLPIGRERFSDPMALGRHDLTEPWPLLACDPIDGDDAISNLNARRSRWSLGDDIFNCVTFGNCLHHDANSAH